MKILTKWDGNHVTNKIGSSLPYYHCLEQLIEKKKEQTSNIGKQNKTTSSAVSVCLGKEGKVGMSSRFAFMS